MILDRAAIDALDDEIQQAEIVLQQRRAFEIQKADTLSESFRLKLRANAVNWRAEI